MACRWFPWLKCSVFTSYVRAPATFSPAQQDRVQVARAERRWNTGVEHRITNVGVANNARSTVVAATGELETRRDRFGTPCSIHDVLISRYTCTRCISFFLFFSSDGEAWILRLDVWIRFWNGYCATLHAFPGRILERNNTRREGGRVSFERLSLIEAFFLRSVSMWIGRNPCSKKKGFFCQRFNSNSFKLNLKIVKYRS